MSHVKVVGLEKSEHNIYSAHSSTYIWSSHPRIKSMSIWPVCRSICLELGHTPIEEDGVRFWFDRASAGFTELPVVWRSEVPALCTLSAALFFAFELEHKKLPTITWSHSLSISGFEQVSDKSRVWIHHKIRRLSLYVIKQARSLIGKPISSWSRDDNTIINNI